MKITTTHILIVLGLIFVAVFQFTQSLIYRKFASWNHKVELPDYVSNVSIHEVPFLCFSNAKTTFYVPSQKVFQFCSDIDPESNIIISTAYAKNYDEHNLTRTKDSNFLSIGSFKNLKIPITQEFSIIYRNSNNNLYGIKMIQYKEHYCAFMDSDYN